MTQNLILPFEALLLQPGVRSSKLSKRGIGTRKFRRHGAFDITLEDGRTCLRTGNASNSAKPFWFVAFSVPEDPRHRDRGALS